MKKWKLFSFLFGVTSYFNRVDEAASAREGFLAPRVRAHLQEKVKRLEADALLTVRILNRRGFVIVTHPITVGEFKDARCSCGGKEVDEEPCACLVKAALVSGFDLSNHAYERESSYCHLEATVYGPSEL